MKSIGIFYGTTTGTTEAVATEIAKDLGVVAADVHDVTKTSPSEVGKYDVIILGASTWGDGDLQSNMHDFLDGVMALDLKGKYAAVFGCGDETMSDTFCDGVASMYESLAKTGATMVGGFGGEGYSFSHSDAVSDGHAVGLLVDNINHEDMTESRIKKWVSEIKAEIA